MSGPQGGPLARSADDAQENAKVAQALAQVPEAEREAWSAGYRLGYKHAAEWAAREAQAQIKGGMQDAYALGVTHGARGAQSAPKGERSV